MSGRYRPNAVLNKIPFCAKYDVSKEEVNNVFAALTDDYLISYDQNKGYFIKKYLEPEIKQLVYLNYTITTIRFIKLMHSLTPSVIEKINSCLQELKNLSYKKNDLTKIMQVIDNVVNNITQIVKTPLLDNILKKAFNLWLYTRKVIAYNIQMHGKQLINFYIKVLELTLNQDEKTLRDFLLSFINIWETAFLEYYGKILK
ncbi:hypothetical protein P344_02045 [Spiroplasma mirum ATCC 29335]|uniref:Uncharacterized protein n=1 Tax=Spiroplasma mirum ATCC 29335 TaxID=838561 RepID=W0GKK9_9MOLU|nr:MULTISPECIES: hypothetical protein [Spiroplasma]AHF60795.1 hypothetical protein SMM_0344 [Spiroplasma mirum ATCC 29335]AHI57757.1 hypothetical protein P344_02045 [Spiroplasma mirum ATCC 29335]AKM52908.1 hypothetical protein SATRI_v1c03890 [Spiroplasma atrichopogonis]